MLRVSAALFIVGWPNMPVLPEFIEVAENTSGATLFLSGDSRAVLFSALAALSAWWQWTVEGGLTAADKDYIDALLSKANTELMQPMIGQIIAYVTTDPPTNSLACDGATYAREDFPDLYAVIDPAFIVDADNFTVPDLRGRVPLGTGEGSGLSAYEVGDYGGVENVTLSAGQMPSHQHGLFTGNGLAVAPGELPVKVPSLLATDLSDLAGGGGSHENRQPFIALKYGIFYQ